MRKKYYGFVYQWKNKRNGKIYIGSHIGNTDDGYIGSGVYFRRAYDIEPENFERTILEFEFRENSKDLLELEQKYLDRIDITSGMFYNLTMVAGGGYVIETKSDKEKKIIYEKISQTLSNKSPEEKRAKYERGRENMSEETAKEAIKKQKATKASWTNERRESMANKMRQTLKENPEIVEERIKKWRKTVDNFSSEKNQKLRKEKNKL